MLIALLALLSRTAELGRYTPESCFIMSLARQRPFSVSEYEYPFRDHWFQRDGVFMHFIDEGDGIPVLMLHGNPTWSFLYRKIISELAGTCRAIAPDYPGFGFSDHPPSYGYTPQEHADWINALINHLNMGPFALVVQDWGGPIGLSIAVSRPHELAGIVLCNTWCWPPTLNARIFSWIMGGPVGKYVHTRHNFFARVMLPAGIAHRKAKRAEVLEAYTDPFPTPEARIGTYVFPRQIRKASTWLKTVEADLSKLKDKPVEMVWAMKDPAFGKEYYIKRWQSHFPDAPIDRIEDASHYLQEDNPERIVAALKRLLKRI